MFFFHLRFFLLRVDGPALRATALITYANWLIADGNTTFVNDTLWPIIELDLNYVTGNWNQSTCVHRILFNCYFLNELTDMHRFDLWEEIDSSSFFTTAVQHRSLREGSALATELGQTSVVSGYDTQADNILCFLQVRCTRRSSKDRAYAHILSV